MFCIFKEAGPQSSENSDEREITLNIRINVNGIKSENIGVDHMTPLTKLLISKARKVEGKETPLYSLMIIYYKNCINQNTFLNF